jgi:seryl-tRNA synthetase
MIDVRALDRSEFAEEYRRSLKNRGADPKAVDELLALNAKRREIITKLFAPNKTKSAKSSPRKSAPKKTRPLN